MASLEELHFEVVLDHAKFDAEIKAVQTQATQLNNSLQNVLKVKNLGSHKIVSDKGVANARDMANYLEQIRQKIQSMPKGNFLVGDADKLTLGDEEITVIACPGHTPGGVSYQVGDTVFCGDTAFAGGGYGRCDLPGGDIEVLEKTLIRLITELPSETVFYPGHGPSTTLKELVYYFM